MPLSGVALPLTPGTIQSPDVPMSNLPQAMPSVAESTDLAAMPIINMPLITKAARLPAALPHLVAKPLVTRYHWPNQMGLITGAPSTLNVQGTRFQGHVCSYGNMRCAIAPAHHRPPEQSLRRAKDRHLTKL